MRRLLTLVLLVLFTVFATGCMAVSTSGDYTLERGKTLRGNLFITSGHARLEDDSRVTGSVFMTSGTLDLGTGAEVEGDVFLTSGNVNLGSGAVVRGDVIGTSGNVRQAESARVEGKVSLDGVDFGLRLAGFLCIPPIVLFGVLLFVLIGLGRRRRTAEGPASRSTPLIIGGVLIVIGALLMVENWADLNLNWWALFILIPALSYLANAWEIYKTDGRLTASARSPLVVGVALLLLTSLFLFELSWGTLWPLFLIIIGVGVLIAR